jgi:hypothetical protein
MLTFHSKKKKKKTGSQVAQKPWEGVSNSKMSQMGAEEGIFFLKEFWQEKVMGDTDDLNIYIYIYIHLHI